MTIASILKDDYLNRNSQHHPSYNTSESTPRFTRTISVQIITQDCSTPRLDTGIGLLGVAETRDTRVCQVIDQFCKFVSDFSIDTILVEAHATDSEA